MFWTPVVGYLLRTILNHVFINFGLARVWDGCVIREIVCVKGMTKMRVVSPLQISLERACRLRWSNR